MAPRDRDWLRIAVTLVGVTLVYNVVEAVVAEWAGWSAGSASLVGFGFDSLIECAAAAVLLWRLAADRKRASASERERAERLARRFIGGTFAALALFVVGQAGWALWSRTVPNESLVGILLAGASLVVMPLVAWAKLRAARELGSRALAAEARETLACSYLSFVLLLGLGLHALAGWWWADPVAALAMVPWLVKEAGEGFSADSCCG